MANHTMEASTTGVHTPAKQGGTGITMLVSALVIAVFVAGFYWYNTNRHVSGKIQSASPLLGSWVMSPDSCRLLPANDGVLISESGNTRLSATVNKDPDGGLADVHIASTVDGKMHELEHDRCGRADLDIHPGEDGKGMSGSLVFDCVSAGGNLKGNVEFQNCR